MAFRSVPFSPSSPSRSQDWAFDALGNWQSVSTDGTTQYRAHNAQNQVIGVGPSALTYDANGNLTTDEPGRKFVYDGWNRLVAEKNSSNVLLVTYAYDALGRRISRDAGTRADYYYSVQWQVLEERSAGVTTIQNVWSPVYVDALVLRDRDADGLGGTLEERLYVQQDANWNVAAITNRTGAVVERYIYDPYGRVTVLAANWTALGYSPHNWVYLHQGGRYDSESGLYHFRNRDYSPTLGRWTSQDPLGFDAGDASLYRYVGNSPVTSKDPSGLIDWWDGFVRIGGLLQFAGGAAEAVLGAGLVAAPEPTTLSKLGGAALMLHGADSAKAGFDTFWNGVPQRTVTASVISGSLQQAGVSSDWADSVGGAFDMGIGLAGPTMAGRTLSRLPSDLRSPRSSLPNRTPSRQACPTPNANSGRRTAEEAGISAAQARRIQNAADRTGQQITVVGSRAKGTAGPNSDWDYILSGKSSQRHSARSSLPRGSAGGELNSRGRESGIDIWQDYNPNAINYGSLRPGQPHVIFAPSR